MREPLIIHHVGCADGMCGAMVLWFGLGRKGTLIPAQYGDDPPPDSELLDREVWIVDFSYPRDVLERMNALAHNLIVFDHHKTAAENCAGLEYCTFDEARSGAMIAFDAMMSLGLLQLQRPAIVDVLAIMVAFVQDRDLWRWELDHSREFSAWLASHPRDLPTWLQLLSRIVENGPSGFIDQGAAILRNNDTLVAAMAPQAEEVDWLPDSGPPQRVLLVNSPVLHSELAAKLLADRPCSFVCVWRRTKDQFVYNLRSTTVDVSAVAKKYGGGGHAQAAGFSSPSRPARFFVTAEKS